MGDILGGILSDVGLGDVAGALSTPTPAPKPQPQPQPQPNPQTQQQPQPEQPANTPALVFTPSSQSAPIPTPSSTPQPQPQPPPRSISTESIPSSSPTSLSASSLSSSATSHSHESSTTIPSSISVAISNAQSTATVTTTATPDGGGGSNNGAIAAGVIACLAVVGILIATVVWIVKRKEKAKRMSRKETSQFRQLEERAVGGGGVHSKEAGIVASRETASTLSGRSTDSFHRAEKVELKPIVFELDDTSVRAEMDGGQRYHAYKPGQK